MSYDWIVPLLTLSAMEIILGVDNVIFIAILVGKLPPEKQARARQVGLGLALVMRLALLFTLTVIMGMEDDLFRLSDLGVPETWFESADAPHGAAAEAPAAGDGQIKPFLPYKANGVSWKDIILLAGGLFLIAKSVYEIHDKLEGAEHKPQVGVASRFGAIIFQIIVLDIVFSLDSVITAVGMAQDIRVMVVAMFIAMGVMLAFAGPISNFVHRHPTMKMLALSFLILIGVMLVADGAGGHIARGYIYFAMTFALVVELLNLRLRAASAHPVQLKEPPPVKSARMLTLLHISDIHLGPYFLPQVAEAMLRAAEGMRPDVIVASGDYTQRAKRPQFADARTLFDRLPPAPLVLTPGNHDVPLYRVWERLTAPYRNYRETFGSEEDSVLRHEQATIVTLNSTAPLRRTTEGIIRPAQLDFCTSAFADAPAGAARIVVAHHPFAPPPDYERRPAVTGAKRAMDRFCRLKVDLVLGGHLHRAYIGHSLDIYAGADREHGVIICQCGTTTSRRGRAREREKNSLNLIRITADAIRIAHYLYFSDSDAFAPVSYHLFPRASRPFFAAPPGADLDLGAPQDPHTVEPLAKVE